MRSRIWIVVVLAVAFSSVLSAQILLRIRQMIPGLPTPWRQLTIGTGLQGSVAFDTPLTTWTVNGSGTEYGNTSSYQFLHQYVTGSQDAIAHVSSCTTTGGFQMCGVSMRTALTATSPNAYCFEDAAGIPNFQWRLTNGGTTNSSLGVGVHHWYRMTVVLGVTSCFYGDDGVAWTQLGTTQTLPVSGEWYVGPAVGSNDDAQMSTGTFTNVSVNLYVPPSLTDYGGYRPHMQGYGTDTVGGRGGVVKKVTNLNNTGAGSFRDAVAPAVCEPRFVVFEVSGRVQLTTELRITCSNLTVAGQTAPSPGFTTSGQGMFIDADHVVFQHFAIRIGDSLSQDAVGLFISNNSVNNVIMDHMSFSWGTHGNLATNAFTGPQPTKIAVLDCLLAEPLAKPGDPFATNFLMQDANGGEYTIARNAFISAGLRQPQMGVGGRRAVYNNYVYNSKSLAGDQGTQGYATIFGGQVNHNYTTEWMYVSNVTQAGPDSHVDGKAVKVGLLSGELAAGQKLYLSDNTGPHMTLADQWGGVSYATLASTGLNYVANEAAVRSDVVPSWWTTFAFVVIPNATVKSTVLARVGAHAAVRDTIDQRVIANANAGVPSGPVISTPPAVGGYISNPGTIVATQTYTEPAGRSNPMVCSGTTATRTVIECDLLTKALAVEVP